MVEAKPKLLILNTQEASKAQPLLQRLCKQNPGWRESQNKNDNWKLKWVSCHVDNGQVLEMLTNTTLQKVPMVNRYPDCNVLAHKDVFGQMMKFAKLLHPQAYDFIPQTFTLPNAQESIRLEAYMKAHPGATYIAKPQVGAQGENICLFNQFKDLPYNYVEKELVIQRYLDRPLLMDGIKFDLRIYVVVVGIDPIQAFIYDEGLARFCTSKYEAPTRGNLKKAFMHLTNYSINKMSDEYIRPQPEEILIANEATKRTLSSLYASLEAKGIDPQTINRSVQDVCSRVMHIYAPLMQHQCMTMTHNKPIPGKPFQILGLDLLIDKELKAWVLEVNDHPSLNIFFDNSGVFGDQKELGEEDVCQVDWFVKSRLVTDTVNLCRQKLDEIQALAGFESLTKIFPSDNCSEAVLLQEAVQLLRCIFYLLTSQKNKASITSQQFEKIAAKEIFKRLEILKVDLSLTYQSVSKGAKQVDFAVFINLVHKLWESKIASKDPQVDFTNFVKFLQ